MPQLRSHDLSVGVAPSQEDLGQMGSGALPLPLLGRRAPHQDPDRHRDDHRDQETKKDAETDLGFLGNFAAGFFLGHGTESVVGHWCPLRGLPGQVGGETRQRPVSKRGES